MYYIAFRMYINNMEKADKTQSFYCTSIAILSVSLTRPLFAPAACNTSLATLVPRYSA